MPRKVLLWGFILVTIMLIFFTGCIPGDGQHGLHKPAGFFWGIWHGWIAPLSLVLGLFKKGTRIYETFNSGWWYDFGFYMALLGGFGSLTLFHKKRKRH